MSQNMTDVVVIGSGITGMAAAITAAEGGAKVILFEKQRSLGGSSNFFEGIFAVQSELQRHKYIFYTKDQAFKNIMDYSHWKANPYVVRAVVDESGESISWLMKNGVEIVEATINMPNCPICYHHVKGYGAAAIKTLAMKAKELGVDIRLGTPITGLLKEGNRVTGVIFEENGEEVEVAAKAVVIGTGGYANNKEWIKKYAGYELDRDVIAIGNTDKMGDGIRMAWEAGAASAGLGLLEMFAAGPVGPDFDMMNGIELVAINPNLWVNNKGKRFCDEALTFFDSPLGNANAMYPYTWRLFDDDLITYYEEHGVDKGMGFHGLPGTKPANFEKEFNAALDRGSSEVCMGNSIEELAEKMEVDPAVLNDTLEEYNRYCNQGHDEMFAKDPRFLKPLTGPKYYAVRTRTLFLGTMGGIKINGNMEVVDKKDNVIGGLYAGGFDAAGMYGDSYCIESTSGLSSSFALNSGRIAGKNALKYLEK